MGQMTEIEPTALGPRLLLASAAASGIGASVADLTARIVTSVVAAVLATLLLDWIRALSRSLKARWSKPPAPATVTTPSTRPPAP